MSESDSQGNAPVVDDELVAYLDGELDAESSQRVEARLATDPEFRQRLRNLEQVWDSLDYLPRAELNEEFTHSTLEMVATEIDRDVTQQLVAAPRSRRRRWLWGASSVAAACLAGFLVLQWTLPDPNEALVQDLPILNRLDIYRETGSLEFLLELDRSGIFTEGTEE